MKTFLVNILLFFLISNSFSVFGQSGDSENDSNKYRNTIRWNLTPNVVLKATSAIFGYERVLNEKHSFSMNIGYMEFPKLIPGFLDTLVNYNQTRNTGFNVAADYRFYLIKRNKYSIPDGFYIGPYAIFYSYKFDNEVSILQNGIVTNEFEIKSNINFFGVGFEAGYQFVIKDRFTIDLLLFGPSMINYRVRASINGNLSANELTEQQELFKEALFEAVPWLKPFLEGAEIDARGRLDHSGLGFRYAVMVGFRF